MDTHPSVHIHFTSLKLPIYTSVLLAFIINEAESITLTLNVESVFKGDFFKLK